MVNSFTNTHYSNIPEEVDTLHQKTFTADILGPCVLRCLRIIDPERDYPRTFAKGRTQRVHQSGNIIAALKDLGYMEDISYTNILYPNERDNRALLMWLQDRLPDEEGRGSITDYAAVVNRNIEQEIDKLVSEENVWLPSFIKCNSETNYVHLAPYASRYIHTPLSAPYNKYSMLCFFWLMGRE